MCLQIQEIGFCEKFYWVRVLSQKETHWVLKGNLHSRVTRHSDANPNVLIGLFIGLHIKGHWNCYLRCWDSVGRRLECLLRWSLGSWSMEKCGNNHFNFIVFSSALALCSFIVVSTLLDTQLHAEMQIWLSSFVWNKGNVGSCWLDDEGGLVLVGPTTLSVICQPMSKNNMSRANCNVAPRSCRPKGDRTSFLIGFSCPPSTDFFVHLCSGLCKSWCHG